MADPFSFGFFPVFQEDIASVRARVDQDVNAGVSQADPMWIDTREGTFYWDITQPVLLEIARLWDALSVEVPSAAMPFFAWGLYLDAHAKTYGLDRKTAVSATGSATFTADEGTVISTGMVVSTDGGVASDPVEFVTSDSGVVDSSGILVLPIVASIAGSTGNVSAQAITTPVSPNIGILSVTNITGTLGGADIETDDALRERILLQFEGQGAGTIADYQRWALSRPGVGRVSVKPVWRGPGTVQVVVMTEDGNPVATTVVADVQAYLDPVDGQANGIAPIGVEVTVTTPIAVQIDVAASLVFKTGYSLEGDNGTIAVRPSVEDSLAAYINSLDVGETVVFDHVKAALFVEGVLAVASVTVNGGTSNITLSSDPAQSAQWHAFTGS